MTEGEKLFDEVPQPEGALRKAEMTTTLGPARVVMPKRGQVELRPMDLESLLAPGHRARLVWMWVEQQDLSGMYAAIKVREGGKGRSRIAPEILFALWLYATLEGEGRGREIARLVMSHDAYRWISGGVQVNHHSLSDFRIDHHAEFDDLLSASVAALMSAGAVKLKRVAQDGMRVRASAGAASFRRRGTLDECLQQARARVQALKEQIDKDPGQGSRSAQAARAHVRRARSKRGCRRPWSACPSWNAPRCAAVARPQKPEPPPPTPTPA